MNTLLIIGYIIIGLGIITAIIVHLPMFGSLPSGEILKKIKSSQHYRDKSFENLEHTPSLTNGATPRKLIQQQINKSKNVSPTKELPFTKTDLHSLDLKKNQLIWFGHSSYLIVLDGKKILVDPVLSNHASPFPGIIPAFKGTNVYTPADIPEIDLLILTHDHRDHLDYNTLTSLKPKIKKIITGLGVGSHLIRRGYDAMIIHEGDRGNDMQLWDSRNVTWETARHFSGRGFTRDQSLWSSFIVQSPTQKIYIGGDSGYGQHFKNIGQKHGPFDLAILECGQYNIYRSAIHMMPEDTLQAAHDLQAKQLLPVHWGKFALSLHSWYEPIDRLITANSGSDYSILTPGLGEVLYLNGENTTQQRWKNID